MPRLTPDRARELGRKGGRATLAKYGREHFVELGRLGFLALAKSLGFAHGYRQAALAQLVRRGKLRYRWPDRDLTPAERADLVALLEDALTALEEEKE
jgi:hypothetical protein